MVRQRPAKPLFPGSNPGVASNSLLRLVCMILGSHSALLKYGHAKDESVRTGREKYICRQLASSFLLLLQQEAHVPP